MIKNYSLNLLQTYRRLTLVLQKIYPLVLIDAYLRLIQCNFLLPNGFLNTISHLGRPNDWWVQNFNHAVQLYEILILFFMRCHRITKPDFRPCSTCGSRSQAPFCLYTL